MRILKIAALAVFVAILANCTAIEVQNFETAEKDLAAAVASLNAAVQKAESDPNLKVIAQDLEQARTDVHNAIDALFGGDGVRESCETKCAHQCAPIDVPGCVSHCILTGDPKCKF